MSIKKLLVAALCISAAGTTSAQDKIFRSNGEVIDTKIKSVERNSIIYSRYDNPSGPEYSISKSEVDKIKYQNGSEESFVNDFPRMRFRHPMPPLRSENERMKGRYKQNILAFAPIQFTENGVAGFSFSYERALDRDNIISFYVPLIAEFNVNNNTNPYTSSTSTRNDGMFYLMPGLKIYPTGGYGICKYAIGPSLVIADGQKTSYNDPYYYSNPYTTENHFVFGMMVNQSININPTPHLYLGTELGMGFSYINQLSGVSQTTEFLVQFNFKVGYRF